MHLGFQIKVTTGLHRDADLKTTSSLVLMSDILHYQGHNLLPTIYNKKQNKSGHRTTCSYIPALSVKQNTEIEELYFKCDSKYYFMKLVYGLEGPGSLT